MRIVNASKSRYYDAAVSNFENAKRCYARAGLAAEWEQTVRHLQAVHRRKTGFLSRLEAMIAGAKPSRAPSFLDRAKTRWDEKRERGKGPA